MKNFNNYRQSYKKSHYDSIQIYCAKGIKERLKSEAEERGISLSVLIIRALECYLDITLSKEPENDNDTES